MSDYIEREAIKPAIEHAMDMQDLYLPAHFLMVVDEIPAADVRTVVSCENCQYQIKNWHVDRRMKDGGYFVYFCDLCDDPFVGHSVCGWPGDFCSKGKLCEEVQP